MRETPPPTAASPLPPLYARWMTALLDGPLPDEPEATCNACAMLPPADAVPGAHYFHPATKCCTYVPALANFLVGGVLAGDESEGRISVEARLDSGVGVLPLGLAQPPTFAVLYSQTGVESFGRSPSIRCPHYLPATGACGIWQHRPSVCSTWFCKHARGASGRHFWMALHRLLSDLEPRLARWCVLELDPGAEAVAHLMALGGPGSEARPPALDDLAAARVPPAVWGRWRGREREFYRECASLVAALSWAEAATIGGIDTRAFAVAARHVFAAQAATELPSRLRVGPFTVLSMSASGCWVSGYSGFDPLDVPRALLDALPAFDGRPTAAALAGIESVHRLRLEPALVRRLVDFEILKPVEPPAQP